MRYLPILLICLLSSCATTDDRTAKVQFLNLKPQANSTLVLEIDLFLSYEEIPGDVIPSDLSEAINDSLRWKWYRTKKLPNACYFIKYAATETEPEDFDYGFAMLDITENSVIGNLLLWPDAGLKIDLDLSSENYVKGQAEWWGGPNIILLDDDGNEIQENSEPSISMLEGQVDNTSSIKRCFEHIRNKI
ncbi:hypothetical protein K0H59_09515 [Shewanella sp. FJAT-51649]|uniref:hypothetical protein n=1 Tax=Shewanella sp. FJAT-51649 TaxID=2864210 RepID=UPI001C65B6D7|nr:hypothetical protein [Shewanella sp. FJAT-51649]QYJ73214.1 hypothetical protein K0H59_09515 [Shewanella sp. FJAT-51649]